MNFKVWMGVRQKNGVTHNSSFELYLSFVLLLIINQLIPQPTLKNYYIHYKYWERYIIEQFDYIFFLTVKD